jgi:hypothetical protein
VKTRVSRVQGFEGALERAADSAGEQETIDEAGDPSARLVLHDEAIELRAAGLLRAGLPNVARRYPRQSPFGYEVYRVAYLAERPLPGIDDDWMLAEHVVRFYTEETFLEKMRGAVAAGVVPPDALERIEAIADAERHDRVTRRKAGVDQPGSRTATGSS